MLDSRWTPPQVVEENAKIAQSTLQHRDELEELRAETLTLQVSNALVEPSPHLQQHILNSAIIQKVDFFWK